ncbi:hypothetical protein OBBRIDRAFT_787417 [Obba rivulosa]|uniref:Chromo domain-containing protein n=1 Tax=Obba rivulosa TaxID=1052685 RepID=A0A8E2J7A8_9APHY|nr:hypothetical protein OBBRIDRAFT_787417 [Obba rivulosa]
MPGRAADSEDEREVRASEEMEVDAEVQGSEAEGDEEEYEIEQILDAKLGTFPEGRYGYLVKWKGYGSEHNSWVDEQDAGNAKALIDAYWKLQKKDKRVARKSGGRPSLAKERKSSTAREESPEITEVKPKKRGRPSAASKAARESPESVDEAEESEEEPAPVSKKKKAAAITTGRRSTGKRAAKEDTDNEDGIYVSMKNYQHMTTWEHIVQQIDTVERTNDGNLMVYFTLKNGKGRAKVSNDEARKKMPMKVLDFYEGHLRWRYDTEA